jgi:isochorismate synthase
MNSADFFKISQNQFDDALPFVLYRKPNTHQIIGMYQDDDRVYYTNNFTESGFVFAPFNSEEEAVLIPKDQSDILILEDDFEVSESSKLKSIDHLDTARSFHINLVNKAKAEIESNLFKKVVLSRKETISLHDNNPLELFKRLLKKYSNAFVYCWYHPKIGLWLGATPETLLSVTGQRFTTMSLAGTQTEHRCNKVTWTPKEINEQRLVTQFIESRLEPLVTGLSTAKVETIKAGLLYHLRTKISGILQANLKDVVAALHPTPAVCGLPQKDTKQFVLDNENYNREFYTGFLGEVNIKEIKSRNTNRRNVENSAYSAIKTVSNLYVNLRCMQLTDTKAHIYVGGGITSESIAEKEWEETCNKAKTMKMVL